MVTGSRTHKGILAGYPDFPASRKAQLVVHKHLEPGAEALELDLPVQEHTAWGGAATGSLYETTRGGFHGEFGKNPGNFSE